MHGACNSKSKFGPAHWGPVEGSKGQITSITVNFKDFYTIFTNERYKTYQMGFSLSPWSFPRGGIVGCLGIKN